MEEGVHTHYAFRFSATLQEAAIKGCQIFGTCFSSKHPIERAWLLRGTPDREALASQKGWSSKYQICKSPQNTGENGIFILVSNLWSPQSSNDYHQKYHKCNFMCELSLQPETMGMLLKVFGFPRKKSTVKRLSIP